ncbi:MAG: DUF309 domain-containing protein [Planctomycetota bacterium]
MREHPPPPMAQHLRRYAPQIALPPYRFLPGITPHPRRDPRGHSFVRAEPIVPYFPAPQWRRNQAYLFGADCYNFGFWWEAHETWEWVWRASARDAIQHDFVKGLIQAAGALLKRHVSQGKMGPSLAAAAVKVLRQVAGATGGVYMGLDLGAWLPRFERFFASSGGAAELHELVLRLTD